MPTPDRKSFSQRALRWTWLIGAAVLLGYLVNVVAAMLLENALIFFPAAYPEGNWKPSGLVFEDAWFQADDGTKLHGWYVPSGRPSKTLEFVGQPPSAVSGDSAQPRAAVPQVVLGHLPRKNARAAILFCHGNGGNITHRADSLKMLHGRCDASVLIFDYRGYGRSQGAPSEAGVMADARAARTWLAEREKILESDVVLMGESLGGAVAVDLAARDGARALVLESTFSSLPDVAAYHYPWLPVRWAMRSRFDSAAKIADYHGPLLMAHGDADTIVPLRFGRRLFEAANEPKQFILMPKHDHNDPMPASFYVALAELLKKLPPSTP